MMTAPTRCIQPMPQNIPSYIMVHVLSVGRKANQTDALYTGFYTGFSPTKRANRLGAPLPNSITS